jgi:hypothetical protein
LRPEATQAEREHGPRAFCSLVGAQKIKTKMAERRSKRVATAAIKKVDGPKQAKKPKHEDNGVNLVTAFLHFLFLWGVDTPSSTAGPLIYFFSPVSHPAARRLQQTWNDVFKKIPAFLQTRIPNEESHQGATPWRLVVLSHGFTPSLSCWLTFLQDELIRAVIKHFVSKPKLRETEVISNFLFANRREQQPPPPVGSTAAPAAPVSNAWRPVLFWHRCIIWETNLGLFFLDRWF